MHLSFFFPKLLTLFRSLLPSLSVLTHPRKCDQLAPLNECKHSRFRMEAELTSFKITKISSLGLQCTVLGNRQTRKLHTEAI